jgi:hypothetical protein
MMTSVLRSFTLTVSITFGWGFVHAQSIEQWTTWGDASMARGEYYGASRFYEGAMALEPGRLSLQWKQAEACRLSHQYDKAAELYATVQRKDMGRTYPDALRWLGEMQLSAGAYDEAERTWNKLLQREKNKRSVVAQRAANALQGIALVKESIARQDTTELQHLPQPVNSFDSEFGARIGPDDALLFTSMRGTYTTDGEVEDTTAYRSMLYRSAIANGHWSEAVALESPVANGHVANVTWSANGQLMYTTRCVDDTPCRIHHAAYDGRSMSMLTPLEGLGDSQSTQPMVVWWQDRELLFFVSDRPGGLGGTDIWKAELRNGTAINVEPLGPHVNTPGNERTPWFDASSSTLWFSSDFRPGLGGYDIFRSELISGSFAPASNAGTPFNSPANDLYPALYPERGEGWLTSNRKGSFAAKGETCCNDLYRWTYGPTRTAEETPRETTEQTTEVIRRVHELSSMQARFPLKLYFHNDEPEPRSWSTTTEQPYGTTYQRYRALEPTYRAEQTDATAMERFFVDDVDGGYALLLELAEALYVELERGASITLEVRGHASPLARNDYNKNLSLRRIASLRNHLRGWNHGVLAPYFDGTATNGGHVALRILPFGEERSATGVSDDLRDLKHSVYSVEAARERRIEVVAVEWSEQGPENTVQRTLRKVGELKQSEVREFAFHVENTSTKPLRLVSSTADCGCTAAALPEVPIPPGGMGEVLVTFNGRAKEGPLTRTVTITTDGTPGTIELVIDGTVVP